MGTQLLNLPAYIPWKLIAVSQDMMDTQFCNKLFPFEWRSSLAISVFEPKKEDLPDDLCDDVITYFKVACSITGYRPTSDEINAGRRDFSYDSPTTDQLNRILDAYYACYGVLLNVAVFPFPSTRQQLNPVTADFSSEHLRMDGPNPYHIKALAFNSTGQRQNSILDITLQNGDRKRAFVLGREVTVAVRVTPKVEAKVVRQTTALTMEAYKGLTLVGSQTTGPEQNQIQNLKVEGAGIDRVVFKTPEGEAFLLEFTYNEVTDVPVTLQDYPHIIDFEPKTRDLYQAATEDGEILTGSISQVKTDKTFISTETTESGFGFAGKLKLGTDKSPVSGEISGNYHHDTKDTNEDRTTIQTDSSRERREKHATTTNLNQMYNLLTGYHAGTNRGVFLMLSRPLTLQPTATFVQGLRYIEGIQDFFLIVARSKDIQGLSIEAFLQTAHFPENVQVCDPEVQYDERHEDLVVTGETRIEDPSSSSGIKDGIAQAIEKFPTSRYTIESGWVIDRRGLNPRTGQPYRNDGLIGDPFHPGIIDLDARQAPDHVSRYNYQAISDSTLQVTGLLSPNDDVVTFTRHFRVLTRSEQPKPSSAVANVCSLDRLFITSRDLCVSFNSGDCPEVVATPVPPLLNATSILDERNIEIPSALLISDETAHTRLTGLKLLQKDGADQIVEVSPTLLTTEPSRRTRLPALKKLVSQIQSVMTGTGRSASSVPIGSVGFLESDFFKDRIRSLLPWLKQMRLENIPNLPPGIVNAFPPHADGSRATIADALEPNIATFARLTGLSVADAAKARYLLLTAKPVVP